MYNYLLNRSLTWRKITESNCHRVNSGTVFKTVSAPCSLSSIILYLWPYVNTLLEPMFLIVSAQAECVCIWSGHRDSNSDRSVKSRLFYLWIIAPYGPSGQTWTANQRIKSPLRYHCATKGWIVNIFFYVPSRTIRGSRMTLEFTSFHVILLCWYYAFGLGVLISRTLVSNLSNASTIVEALLSYLFWHLPLQFP